MSGKVDTRNCANILIKYLKKTDYKANGLTSLKLPYVVAVAALSAFIILVSVPFAFAQTTSETNQSAQTIINKTQTQANVSDIPVLEEVSDNGLYRVQLKWAQLPIVPKQGIEMQVVFLNASIPQPTEKTVPVEETNQTGFSTPGASGYTDPSVIQSQSAVESYDITIYSDSGQELWKAEGQPVNAGAAFERIEIQNYTGGITIEITNIKPLQQIGSDENNQKAGNEGTDSVRFTARIE